MNNHQMQALSGKELNYIADSIANEDMLIKMCAAAVQISTHPQITQAVTQHIQAHEQHMDKLRDALKQHQPLAPGQTQ
ncbi:MULTISPECIES: hypothetical protein [Paenibacillus]|uniref:Uncharacterized protein n=1 Tax=Paenibacillus apis TaxID=1792174 RepID=A0A919Y597_9BACL|nr:MULTISPECIES: hypothetical protein [Paenibacillus]GIO42663.1 hypothetical protein J41TS4_24210 [Paenibacillus apis]